MGRLTTTKGKEFNKDNSLGITTTTGIPQSTSESAFEIESQGNKDKRNGYTGLSDFSLNMMSANGLIKSVLTNDNPEPFVYSLQARPGTIADLSDVASLEPRIAPTGNSNQYLAGDKVFRTLPTGTEGAELVANKDTPNGYVGLTARKINVNSSSAGNVTSYILNATIGSAKNWSLPPMSGTFALTSNLLDYKNVTDGLAGLTGNNITLLDEGTGLIESILRNTNASSVTYTLPPITGTLETQANRGASNGYVGMTSNAIDFKNGAGTVTSFLINNSTFQSNYTFQTNRSGTIADLANIATGSTDNAVLRADGTGGATSQNSVVVIDDNGVITLLDTASPSTPAAGFVKLYAKSGDLYQMDSTGAETQL